ncbi:TBC1 domain family member 13 [Blattella germanica]|nr:TBC1 domain family member 13 [Blattella germanica]
MAVYKARLKEFDDVLEHEVINLKNLKKLCFNGVPDEKGRRALCWKLLLNYLPLSRGTWSETLTRKRELYKQFIGNSPIVLCH